MNQEGGASGWPTRCAPMTCRTRALTRSRRTTAWDLEDDERDFRIGAALLRRLGFGAVRLMTNNPRKVAMMQAHGIAVPERVPLVVPRNRHNTGYLDVKAEKSGHLL
ncbi:hypothetical protein FLP41_04900 [Paracoccus marcusii]|uniref:hypothetical protein n=1 Tax=Paracoccus marcusii TaxID=59779 RepID=UPI002ED198AE|nr:hypothetical protein FLP41_04900 [Paracoccus marcusii]